MFTTRHSEQLKLIDFGLAARLDPDHPVKVTTGEFWGILNLEVDHTF